MEPLLRIDEAARVLNCSRWLVRALIRDHRLRAVRVGMQYRISPVVLAEFISGDNAVKVGQAAPLRLAE